MDTTIELTPVHTAPRQEAFAVARTLEHAGITTTLRRENQEYSVLVSSELAERAAALV
jgi:hypothetical protein